jgi:hypothetical protein
VSRRLRLVDGERREAERVPDALIRRVRGAMIEVEGVSKAFGQTKALAGVDMSVPAGWRCVAGERASTASVAKAATSTSPATIPAVVRISLNPNRPIHTDRR